MIGQGLPIYVALEPVDMRMGYERLGGLVRERMRAEPRSKALFVLYPFGLTRHGQTAHTVIKMLSDGKLKQAAKARHVERRWRAASAEFRGARVFASN